MFLRAQPVIRAACPLCAILLAGISNQYESGESVDDYAEILDSIVAAGLDRPFDVFDYYKAAPVAPRSRARSRRTGPSSTRAVR